MSDHKGRDISLDIVRSCATFFVLSIHFLLNSGYYQASMVGRKMFLVTAFRWLFYTCVPLFLIITGFLQRNSIPSKSYYKKIGRILFEYIMASILCSLFKIFYLHQDISVKGWIKSILDYSAAPYSWYVNMYIGLFILIPFLNIIYNGIDQYKKKILIFTILLLTAVPTFFNSVLTCLIGSSVIVFPNWWTTLYPISYYFIGAYIAEYKMIINKWIAMAGVILTMLAQTVLSFIISKGGSFSWDAPQGYGALSTVILSVLAFSFLYSIKISNRIMVKLVTSISSCSLSIYLLSWIFDKIIYQTLNKCFTQFHDKILYYFIVAPVIFILSYISSLIISKFYKYLILLSNYIKYNFINGHNTESHKRSM